LPKLGENNTFEQCISEMALAGFQGCEVGNKFPRNTKILKERLELRNIKIINAWYSTFFTTKKKKETIEGFIKHRDFLHEMGAKVIGVSEQGFSIQGNRNKNIFKDKHNFTEKQ
jgi:inosose dehydratase